MMWADAESMWKALCSTLSPVCYPNYSSQLWEAAMYNSSFKDEETVALSFEPRCLSVQNSEYFDYI